MADADSPREQCRRRLHDCLIRRRSVTRASPTPARARAAISTVVAHHRQLTDQCQRGITRDLRGLNDDETQRIQISWTALGHTRGERAYTVGDNGVCAAAVPAGVECRRHTRESLHGQRNHHRSARSRSRRPAPRPRPMTGDEYLDSMRDGREIWIYGERVKDVTTHPAFRNTARMIARLYDALHDPKRKDVLTTGHRHRQRRLHAPVLRASRNAEELVGARDAIAEWAASRTAGSAAVPTTRPRSSPTLGANSDFYAPLRRERPALVQESPGRGVLRQPRDRQPAGRSRQAARRSQRRLHARRKGNRRRADRERRQGGRDDVEPDAPQLHREQRRAPHQDERVRVRVHGAAPTRLA